MIEHAMRVASEASEERIPDLIAEWSRRHPALARREPADAAPDALGPGTERLATGPGAEA
jgi:hypothetical protein